MNDSDTAVAVRPLGMLLLFAATRVETRYEAALAEVGLSLPKLGVLKHLVDATEPLPLSRLADRMACVKSNITQLVDRLEAEGLVERMNDSADRRCVRASITKAGRDRFKRGKTVLTGLEDELFGETSSEDRECVLRFLAALGSPCS